MEDNLNNITSNAKTVAPIYLFLNVENVDDYDDVDGDDSSEL